MTTFVTKTQYVVEDLKMFLQASRFEGIMAKLNNVYVVIVQFLVACTQILSMFVIKS